MQFKDILDVCQPANFSLIGSAIVIAVWLMREYRTGKKLTMKSLIPVIALGLIAVITAINLDVYCKTKHGQFAWFMAGLSFAAIACLALCEPEAKKA